MACCCIAYMPAPTVASGHTLVVPQMRTAHYSGMLFGAVGCGLLLCRLLLLLLGTRLWCHRCAS